VFQIRKQSPSYLEGLTTTTHEHGHHIHGNDGTGALLHDNSRRCCESSSARALASVGRKGESDSMPSECDHAGLRPGKRSPQSRHRVTRRNQVEGEWLPDIKYTRNSQHEACRIMSVLLAMHARATPRWPHQIAPLAILSTLHTDLQHRIIAKHWLGRLAERSARTSNRRWATCRGTT